MWSRSYGAIDKQIVTGLVLAPDDDIVIAVQMNDLINFGGSDLISGGASDVAMARFGP